MRPPTILDVVRAVKHAARHHGEVRAWWYAPPKRLRLGGQPSSRSDAPEALEVVIEAPPGEMPDCEAIARVLSRELAAAPVHVRPHAGQGAERGLYRLLSGPAPGTRP